MSDAPARGGVWRGALDWKRRVLNINVIRMEAA
jgi:hypothetical protein